jgi:predicted transposase YdaD
VHDIRETRVYQEAKAEGVEEGIQRERQRLISKLAAGQVPAERIAELCTSPRIPHKPRPMTASGSAFLD